MSVNRNHWDAKPYQLSLSRNIVTLVTTGLDAWAKGKVDPSLSSLFDWIWAMKRNAKKVGVCYPSHGTLAMGGNDKVRKRRDMKVGISISPPLGDYLLTGVSLGLAVCCYAVKFQKQSRARKS